MADTTEARNQVLELSTLLPEDRGAATLVIDGEPYYWRNTESMGLEERAELAALVEEMNRLESLKKPKAADARLYKRTLVDLACFAVVDAPREKFEAVVQRSEAFLMTVIMGFFAEAVSSPSEQSLVMMALLQRIGGSRFLASTDSGPATAGGTG